MAPGDRAARLADPILEARERFLRITGTCFLVASMAGLSTLVVLLAAASPRLEWIYRNRLAADEIPPLAMAVVYHGRWMALLPAALAGVLAAGQRRLKNPAVRFYSNAVAFLACMLVWVSYIVVVLTPLLDL